MSADRERRLAELLRLSREVGSPTLRMAILGEGNTSARLGSGTFVVKASGCCLESLQADGLTECRFDRLLPLLDRAGVSDDEIDQALLDARVDPVARKPSVEAIFHAWLLGLPGVETVGHCHPVAVNRVLCSPRARDFARRRTFPDEIVCCGTESVFVPYVDPGLPLARAIRRETLALVERTGRPPRLILLANHGIIAVGPNPGAVLSSLQMAEKAAEIFAGAAALGGPVFLSPDEVGRIARRPDEHHRQRMLNL